MRQLKLPATESLFFLVVQKEEN
jgi:hypothetical protein